MQQEAQSIVASTRQQATSSSVRMKKEQELEVHILAEVVLGKGFRCTGKSHLGFCSEVAVIADPNWVPLSNQAAVSSEMTQTCFPESSGIIWSHLVDLHYATNTITEWPKLRFKVFASTPPGTQNIPLAYGIACLPTQPGPFEITLKVWRPKGPTFWSEMNANITGESPVILENPMIENMRKGLVTKAAGEILIRGEIVLRKSSIHGLALKTA
jgi:Ciliary basal body-associated, B9 protein